ncbi:hypothetical protein G4B88_011894 [Cannabis sativa]|uniref:Uncharacterized protein n=1 Tax=Cannabis sativa TaxID=3483 RepID=A0A7J6HEF7_CANSA|nr:hypothetical protein G4B88_011894 [Cannabis sativa]
MDEEFQNDDSRRDRNDRYAIDVFWRNVMEVKVTVISTSPDKKEEAIDNLGANSFFIIRDQNQIEVP